MVEYVVVGVVVMAAVAYLVGHFAFAAKGKGPACRGCAESAGSNPRVGRKQELVQIRVEKDEA